MLHRITLALVAVVAFVGAAGAQPWGPITPSLNVRPIFNGWTPTFGVSDSSNGTPAAAGTGNAVGDVLTLNDGCATHAKVTVSSVTSSGVTGYNITTRGSCLIVPSNPVSVASTTGAGSGATFTLAWGPIVAGLNYGTLVNNRGNMFLTGCPTANTFSGTESNFLGYCAGGATTAGDFILAIGHNALGIGGGCTGAVVNTSATALGTDSLRNGCGITNTVSVGTSALYKYAGSNASTHAGWGTTAVGTQAMYYWNGGDFPWNTALGDLACGGASSGSVTFSNGTCVGTNTGKLLSTASNFLILAGGGNGNVGSTTFASGSGVILVGSGAQVVDTPAAGTTNYINLENVLKVTGTNTVGTSIASLAGALQVGTTTNFTLAGGEFGLSKITASGTAPGAGAVKLAAVAGTTGGTCKLVAYAGTSTTAVTILDNIGSGC